jgi:hypothetical protein
VTRKSDPKAARSNADWEKIEAEYRAGVLTVRSIATEHGISHTAIQKRAKRDGWTRDLKAKIKAQADALVASREVASEVAKHDPARAATDRAIIDANAEVIAQVRLGHRKDIARARRLAMGLLVELEVAGTLTGEIERVVAAIMADTQDTGGNAERAAERLKALDKLLELPTRTGAMKALAETMSKLVTMEREAYDLDNAGDKDNPSDVVTSLRDLLARNDGAGTGLPRGHAQPA